MGQGLLTNKHSTRKLFLDNGESVVYEEKVAQKFAVLLGRPTLLLYLYCVVFFYILGIISRLHYVGLL